MKLVSHRYTEISMHPVWSHIPRAITQVTAQYHKLILITGDSAQMNRQVLHTVATQIQCNPVNLTLTLGKEFITRTGFDTAKVIIDFFNTLDTQPLCLDAIDILFDRSLKQTIDPFSLLRKASRHRIIIATWLGRYTQRDLYYATFAHDEYRHYQDIDVIVLDTN